MENQLVTPQDSYINTGLSYETIEQAEAFTRFIGSVTYGSGLREPIMGINAKLKAIKLADGKFYIWHKPL